MNVNKYKLVAAPRDDIEAKINALIETGWQPFGDPFLVPEKDGDLTTQINMICQAMIRLAEPA